MLPFRIALVAYSTRRILPLAVAVFAIAGALVIAVPEWNVYDCGFRAFEVCGFGSESPRFAWQVPLAVLIGVVGLGSAGLIALWNRRLRRTRPLPPLPAGWQTGG
jgi:hypothetical protein